MDNPAQAIEEARRAGIDLDELDKNLARTVTERIKRHDEALTLALELQAEGLIGMLDGLTINQVFAIAAKRENHRK
jgi:hypothetical protein